MHDFGEQICARSASNRQDCSSRLNKKQQQVHSPALAAGTVQVAEVQAGWQKPLDVRGLTWTEPEELGGRQLASVQHMRTTKPLLDIVKGSHACLAAAYDAL